MLVGFSTEDKDFNMDRKDTVRITSKEHGGSGQN